MKSLSQAGKVLANSYELVSPVVTPIVRVRLLVICAIRRAARILPRHVTSRSATAAAAAAIKTAADCYRRL